LNCERCDRIGEKVEASIRIYEFHKLKNSNRFLCKNCFAEFRKQIPNNRKCGYSYKIVRLDKVKVVLV
jgi:hypothetical protein